MANIVLSNNSPAIAMVREAQLDSFDAATTYGITINGKTISVAGDTDAATTISNLVTAFNAAASESYPEFAEITAAIKSGATDTIQLTADTKGNFFDAQTFTSGGTGTMSPTTGNSATATTANSGPEDAAVAGNYVGGALPTNSDTLIVENTDQNLKYQLDQFATNTFPIIIAQSFEGEIGLIPINEDGTKYFEYRATHFKMKATSVRIGSGPGNGSALLKLDFNSATGVTLTVDNTGSPADADQGALQVKGMTGDVDAKEGSIGIAIGEAETATINTIDNESAEIVCGTGCTTKDINQLGGGSVLYRTSSGASDDITVKGGGTVTAEGAASASTIKIFNGTVNWNASGNIGGGSEGDVTVYGDGILDFSELIHDITISGTALFYSGATIRDPENKVTWSNGWKTKGCRLEDVNFESGFDRTYTPS